MSSPDAKRNRRYYLVAPRGARPLWFTAAGTGAFLLVAGLAVAAYFYATGWNSASAGVGPTGGWAIMLFGAILLMGGVYLRRTNPYLGIVGFRPGNKEGKGPGP